MSAATCGIMCMCMYIIQYRCVLHVYTIQLNIEVDTHTHTDIHVYIYIWEGAVEKNHIYIYMHIICVYRCTPGKDCSRRSHMCTELLHIHGQASHIQCEDIHFVLVSPETLTTELNSCVRAMVSVDIRYHRYHQSKKKASSTNSHSANG